jgi:predicted patatin/cPLA2 family phospholipase
LVNSQARFERPERQFIAVATNCLTGEISYFAKGKYGDILQAIRASATMPYISPMVMIDGTPYLDGGCACKIPYQWALDEGFERIIVIRTREHSYRKQVRKSSAAFKFYRKYPMFAQKLADSTEDYNRQCDDIEKLHAQGRLMCFAPSEPVTVSRLEGDMEKLGALYWLGWNDCVKHLDTIRTYLGVQG